MTGPIEYTVEIISSKADRYGNRYFAAIITRTSDGAAAKGKVDGGASNVEYAMRELTNGSRSFGSRSFTTYLQEMPIREYDRLTKHFPLLGSRPGEIKQNVLAQLG